MRYSGPIAEVELHHRVFSSRCKSMPFSPFHVARIESLHPPLAASFAMQPQGLGSFLMEAVHKE